MGWTKKTADDGMEMLRDGGGNNSIEIKRQKRSSSSEGQLSGDEAEVQE